MEEYKKFEDLEPRECDNYFTRAGLTFANGYGISVVNGKGAYTSSDNEYEIAVEKRGSITYDTPITSDVIGYLSKEEVTEIMKQIQDLENA